VLVLRWPSNKSTAAMSFVPDGGPATDGVMSIIFTNGFTNDEMEFSCSTG